jgi:hypothetical protein
MKKNILSILLLAFLMNGTKLSAQESFKWKEMNDFHTTAMKGFHSAEAGNLKPAKDSSAAILEKARAWQSSVASTPYDKKEITALLQQLNTECKAINDAVIENKPDKILTSLVMKAHNTFHAIIGKVK